MDYILDFLFYISFSDNIFSVSSVIFTRRNLVATIASLCG